ncbi:MAG: hypothetical protein K8I30_05840 [Anaerolineae bacterium]|nr:hypothetical protein [Anaerolineae bacterium]
MILRYLLKFIAVAVTLLLICVAVLIAILLFQRSAAESEIVQQLTNLDTYFVAVRNPIPLDSTVETLLPETNGDFQRGEIYSATGETKVRCFNPYFSYIDNCSLATYKSDDVLNEFGRGETVWIEVWQKNNELRALTGTFPCGAELGGTLILRTVSKVPYAYHECSGFLLGSPSLVGIIWENSDWFISLEGNYAAFSQFLAAYPY